MFMQSRAEELVDSIIFGSFVGRELWSLVSEEMWKLFSCILMGVVCGWLLRRRRIKGLNTALMVVICLLLFVLGLEVAHSQSEMANILVVVGIAIVVALCSTAGSVLMAWFFGRPKKDR